MAKKQLKYKQGVCMYCGQKIPFCNGRLYAWCNETHRSNYFTKSKLDRLNSKYSIESFAMMILRGMDDVRH